jgi:hypothetical protein
MSEWIETQDRLPEESSGPLKLHNGRQVLDGSYQQGAFMVFIPDAEGKHVEYESQEILRWRLREADEL